MPTPTATPENLLSNNLIIPHFSAQASDIIVLYAPLSTNAYTGCLLTLISTYNMQTEPKFSGINSYALSRFS